MRAATISFAELHVWLLIRARLLFFSTMGWNDCPVSILSPEDQETWGKWSSPLECQSPKLLPFGSMCGLFINNPSMHITRVSSSGEWVGGAPPPPPKKGRMKKRGEEERERGGGAFFFGAAVSNSYHAHAFRPPPPPIFLDETLIYNVIYALACIEFEHVQLHQYT